MFTDRQTCEYCSDVVRRINKNQKEGRFYESIDANFDLVNIDGGPFYGGEPISGQKMDQIDSILANKTQEFASYGH